MNTDQARRLITLHDNADRALANLRNAGAMSSDDPRATEMLESAGDAYAEATKHLAHGSAEAFESALEAAVASEKPVEPGPPTQPSGSAPGAEDSQLVQIVPGEGSGAGFVEANVEGIAEGNVAVRLTTAGVFRGEQFPEGATISVPVKALTLEQPEDAPPSI